MKILLAAPQDRTSVGVIAGYVRDALTALGHDVRCFDFRERPYSHYPGLGVIKRLVRFFFPRVMSPYDLTPVRISADRKINAALLTQVSGFRPDVFLALIGENISLQTLEVVRKEFRAVTVNWMLDTLLLTYRADVIRQAGAGYDFLFMIDSREVLDAVRLPAPRVYTLPVGFQQEVHRSARLSEKEKAYYGSDIAFVGTMTPFRQKILETLAGFDLKIWGRWDTESPLLKRCYRKRDIYAQEAAKVYAASRIVIDIHGQWNLVPVVYNVTPRVFEVPACGGFLLTTPSVQLESLFEIGREMIVFQDAQDLKQKITYYLEHADERLEIAGRAAAKTRGRDPYTRRMQEMLDIVRKKP
jgi:spore maturation protein CgeB